MRWDDFVERLKRASGLTDRQIAAMEKRKAFRVHRRFGIIATRSNGENLNLMVLDCAPTGLRLDSPTRLKVGELLVLSVAEPGSRRPSMNSEEIPRARVVWVRKVGQGLTVEAGLSFQINTQVQRRGIAYFLLEECKVGISNPKENRRAPRISKDMRAVIKGPNVDQIGQVKDISAGGILLNTPRSIPRNAEVEMAVQLPGVVEPLKCSGTVLRCVSRRDDYEVGIVFTPLSGENKERLLACLTKLLKDTLK